MASADTVVVFAGGPAPPPSVAAGLPEGATIVAADRGAAHALALGLRVDVAIGDFDSLAPAARAALERDHVRLEAHPATKDATDLELALSAAASRSARGGSWSSGAPAADSTILSGSCSRSPGRPTAASSSTPCSERARLYVIRRERRLRGKAARARLAAAAPRRRDRCRDRGPRLPTARRAALSRFEPRSLQPLCRARRRTVDARKRPPARRLPRHDASRRPSSGAPCAAWRKEAGRHDRARRDQLGGRDVRLAHPGAEALPLGGAHAARSVRPGRAAPGSPASPGRGSAATEAVTFARIASERARMGARRVAFRQGTRRRSASTIAA